MANGWGTRLRRKHTTGFPQDGFSKFDQERWAKLVQVRALDLGGRSADLCFYPQQPQTLAATQDLRPRRFALVRSFRTVRTGDRVLRRSLNGVSADRFRRILESENCSIRDVEHSDDTDRVVIKFTYLDDGGHCMAMLTDKQPNGTYIRCMLSAVVSEDLPPNRVNELNKWSKFLKFWWAEGKLILEYNILMIDLPDSSIAANLDAFHGSARYIVGMQFVYPHMSAEPSASEATTAFETASPTDTRSSFDLSRSDLNGIEHGLDRILSTLQGYPGNDLKAVVNRLEDIRSLLRDILSKLSRLN